MTHARGDRMLMVVLGAAAILAAGAAAGGRAAAQPARSPELPDGAAQCADARQRLAAALAGSAPDPGLDERLYASARCDEVDGDVGSAIALLEQLRARVPASPLAAQALARIGALHARTARHAEAAAALEAYAKTYPAEPDAATALADAVAYRKALGDDAQAIDDTRLFIRLFGGKRPAEAAGAFFGLTSIYEQRGKPDAVVDHLRAYLKTYGGKGGGDRVVIAHARIGELRWQASCPVKTTDGSCVALAPARPMQCGPASRRAVRVLGRDPRAVKEAMAGFAAAIKAYDAAGGRFAGGDEAGARHAYAIARFHQAEVTYERYLALAVPAGLDFDPARPAAVKRSTARFSAWLTDKQRLGAQATDAYARLLFEVKDPDRAIAAAARTGQVALAFVDALYPSDLPAPVARDPDARAAYCDGLTTVAAPLEQRAIEAFGACLRVAGALAWSSSWSTLCERELGQLAPDDFPAATELRPSPPATAPPLDVEPAIDRLPPPPPTAP